MRLGIHTGPVVVGEIGGGRHDPLAVGETLTIAARLKDLAAPGMVVISATTARLVEGYFLWQEKAVPPLQGVTRAAWPMMSSGKVRHGPDSILLSNSAG